MMNYIPRAAWALALGAGGWCGAVEPAGEKRAELAVVGYLPEYRVDTFNPRQAALITDLVYFVAEPQASGELNLSRIQPRHLEKVKKLRLEHGTRLHLALGGWGRCEGFAPVAADAEKRKLLTAAARELCREHEFAGIDLDWEFPKEAEEEQNCALLLADLHAGLAEDKRTLSIAIAPWQNLPREAWKHVDRVHLMSYDHEGRHATFAQAEKDIARVLEKGVPREKLLLGLPCYGRKLQDRDQAIAWLELVGRHDPPGSADETAGYYYNGPATIQRKTRLAQTERLGGIFFWELGQDTDGARSLVRAARHVLER